MVIVMQMRSFLFGRAATARVSFGKGSHMPQGRYLAVPAMGFASALAALGRLAVRLAGLLALWGVCLGAANAGVYGYISHFASNVVTVIDAASNTLVTTITVGSGPRFSAASPDGTRVYVPSWSGTVSVIDTATNTVTATITTGAGQVLSYSARTVQRPMWQTFKQIPSPLSTRPLTRWRQRSVVSIAQSAPQLAQMARGFTCPT